MKIALAVFCFWVSSLCLGQQTAADYEISGTVVDANSGVPLSQSDVTVTPAATRTGGQTQTTHEGGHFHFEHLPAGKYALCAARQGYLPQCFNQHDDFSTAIVVGPGVDSEPLVFRLEHSARVIGTITDPNRDPISNAMVYLIRKGVARSGPGRMNQKSTNDLGR